MATITYNLAPVPRWLFTDQFGRILSDGYMMTFRAINHSQLKTVYKDPAGTIPWTNPVEFEENGMPDGALYWESDENYYLEIYDSNDVLQFTIDNYNAPGFVGGGDTGDEAVENYVRNPQFTFWHIATDFPIIYSSVDTYDYVVDDWFFVRSNFNATFEVSRQTFPLGQTEVPNNPVYFLRYNCTNAGAGAETFKIFRQEFNSAQTLSGKTVTFSIFARSSTNSPLAVNLTQYFGSGGSPSANVVTTVLNANLTSTWTRYSATVTLPSVSGKTLGTNGDDGLLLDLGMPLNQTGIIDMCNVQLEPGDKLNVFKYLTVNEQVKRLDYVKHGSCTTGDIIFTVKVGAPPGWIFLDDGTIGSEQSGSSHIGIVTKALFVLLWDNIPTLPIFTSGGVLTGRGASAEDDFNANKRLALPNAGGRVFGNAIGLAPLGFVDGTPTHALSIVELATHNHETTIPNHVHGTATTTNFFTEPGPDGLEAGNAVSYLLEGTTGAAGGGTFPSTNTGSGVPFSIIQPTIYLNALIKL